MTEDELLKRIGLRIKQLRTAKGWSQAQFGDRIDVEKSNVSRLEAGKFNIKIYTLYNVAKGLGITLSELLKNEK